MHIGHSGYLRTIYQNPQEFRALIRRVTAKVKRYRAKHPFDAIAFCGSSGAAVAFPVACKLGIPVVQVRKATDQSHGRRVEGPAMVLLTYAIIDDCIASGSTVRHIHDGLSDAVCVAIFIYRPDLNCADEKFKFPNQVETTPIIEIGT